MKLDERYEPNEQPRPCLLPHTASMRPHTSADISELVRKGEPFDFCLRNFLDEFRYAPDPSALKSEPVRLHGAVAQGDLCDAYLAATAESLQLNKAFPSLHGLGPKTGSCGGRGL